MRHSQLSTPSSRLRKYKFIFVLPKTLGLALLLAIQPSVYADKASAPANATYLHPLANTDSPYFKGGKIDAFYDRNDNGDFQVNSILWSPVFKGGHGIQVSETGEQNINYYGGFVRPLIARPELG
jgi:hypothetical protein